jgi:hypothetical protein
MVSELKDNAGAPKVERNTPFPVTHTEHIPSDPVDKLAGADDSTTRVHSKGKKHQHESSGAINSESHNLMTLSLGEIWLLLKQLLPDQQQSRKLVIQ